MDFFDAFFFWVLATTMILAAVDWWIGPEGRDSMKNEVGIWWFHIEEMSFRGLVSEDARRVSDVIHQVFGERVFSWRFVACLSG